MRDARFAAVDPARAPFRRVVERKQGAYFLEGYRRWGVEDVLECGHTVWRHRTPFGFRAPDRRRCPECALLLARDAPAAGSG